LARSSITKTGTFLLTLNIINKRKPAFIHTHSANVGKIRFSVDIGCKRL